MADCNGMQGRRSARLAAKRRRANRRSTHEPQNGDNSSSTATSTTTSMPIDAATEGVGERGDTPLSVTEASLQEWLPACSVCWDDVVVDPVCMPCCSNTTCQHCLMEWASKSRDWLRCPMCNVDQFGALPSVDRLRRDLYQQRYPARYREREQRLREATGNYRERRSAGESVKVFQRYRHIVFNVLNIAFYAAGLLWALYGEGEVQRPEAALWNLRELLEWSDTDVEQWLDTQPALANVSVWDLRSNGFKTGRDLIRLSVTDLDFLAEDVDKDALLSAVRAVRLREHKLSMSSK
jgi:hypothetical protein